MSLTDSLSSFFGGTIPASATNPTATNSNLPLWQQDFLQGLATNAVDVSEAPLFDTEKDANGNPVIDPATGKPKMVNGAPPAVAPLAPDQNNAINAAEVFASGQQPINTAMQGANALSNIMSGYDPNVTKQFMNPYMDSVVNDIQTLGNRNLTENVLPAVNDTFTGSGQFGSGRNADFTARAIRDNQQTTSMEQDQALQAGYTQAQNTNLNNLAGIRQGAVDAANVGNTIGGLEAQNVGLLGAAGQQQWTENQMNLNAARSDYTTQQQYPKQQLNFLSGVLNGLPGQPSGSTLSQYYPNAYGSSPFASLTGAGALLGALGGNTNPTTTTTAAKGGHIQRFARGGPATAGLPAMAAGRTAGRSRVTGVPHGLPPMSAGLPGPGPMPPGMTATPAGLPPLPVRLPAPRSGQTPMPSLNGGAMASMPGSMKPNRVAGPAQAIGRPGGASVGQIGGGGRRTAPSDGLSQMLGRPALPQIGG